VYANAQNVHASSVQAGVNDSVTTLLKVTRTKDWQGALRDVMRLSAPWMRILKFTRLVPKWQCIRIDPFTMRRWCQDNTIHSVHGMTFGELLGRVYCIIKDHEHRDALMDILNDELQASRTVCFTGRFSRVVNVLNGFVEGVHIGISPREQLQHRFATLAGSGADDATMLTNAIKTLEELNIRVPQERRVWIEAVGIERDLAGLPVAWVPADILRDAEKSPAKRAQRDEFAKLVRSVRRDANEAVKKLVKDKLASEDDERRAQDDVQKLTDKMIAEVDKLVVSKEQDIMAV
jgi:hypothetical protein